MNRTTRSFSLLLAAAAALPLAATAQVPQASAAALGLGGNVTAGARGFAAVANNPAGLAHPASPGFSLAIPAIEIRTGLGPIELSDLADWEGELIPTATKTEWLQRVVDAGGQSGALDVGVTAFALSVGAIGVQAGAIAGGETDLTPDAAEILLFGNAGRTGAPGDFDLTGSAVDAFALSTVAVSYGFRASPRLSLGVTGTYVWGNGILVGRDMGSIVENDPLGVELAFPLITPDFEEGGFDRGTGVGLDVGALWDGPMLTLGATIRNLFHTFEWSVDELYYRPGEATFYQGESSSDFDEQPASAAPAEILELLEDRTIEPVFSVGALWRPSSLLHVTADVRKRVSGGLEIGPELYVGAGAELRALSILPLRAHAAVVTGGVQVGGGATLVLGPVNLSGAAAYRTDDGDDGVIGMFTLSFGGS